MKRLFAIAALSFLVACGDGKADTDPVADGPTQAPLTEQMVADMDIPAMADRLIVDGQVLGDLLATVTSAETAEAARPEIEAMVANYQTMLKRLETLDQPNFSDIAALASRGAKLTETQQVVMDELRRIYANHPEAVDVLRDTLNDFGQP